MKMFSKMLEVETKKINDVIDLTEKVQNVVKESRISNGIVFVNSLHNTACVTIQENDPTIHKDMFNLFERILPAKGKYVHSYEGNENATAHQKTNLLHTSVSVPLKDGRLLLGSWQSILFFEFFEARKRKIVVTIFGE
jgi:secondary thiamine-phosphate synthase enzyme